MHSAPQASHGATEIVLTVAVFIVAVWAAVQSQLPPAVVSASAPTSEFSAERAMTHLKVIARNPHPIGTTENARVREYVLQQLRLLNLTPETQTATGTDLQSFWGPPYWTGRPQNILARLNGRDSTGALLLMAHYDSVPTGPGAADDGSGVVALLEIVRALHSTPPLRNDVLLVFTDGEEAGLLGAQAFVDDHPWFREARVALALDSGGACGVATMHGGSHPNGWYVPELARVAPSVVASSLLDVFVGSSVPGDQWPAEQAGIPAFAVGFEGCHAFYHTQRDSPEDVNLRSLQHLGTVALALARDFGNVNLGETNRKELIYFKFLGSMLYYPVSWVRPLLVVSVLALIAVFGLGLRKKRLNVGGAALGLVFWILTSLAAWIVGATISWTMSKAGITKAIFLSVYNQETYAFGLKLLVIALVLALFVGFRGRLSIEHLTSGGLLLCALFLIPTSILVPEASFVFMWPLWCSTIALATSLITRPETRTARIGGLLLSVPVIVLLMGPIVYVDRIDGLSVAALTIALGLFVSLVAPGLDILTSRYPWAIPLVAGLSGLIVLVLAARGGGYSARHPRADSVCYWLDADNGKAHWLSFDESPDAWTSQFLRGTVERGRFGRLGSLADRPTLRAQASVVKLPAPEVSVLKDSAEGQSRSLLLHIVSHRQARVVWVAVEKVGVLRATVNGKRIPVRDIDTRARSWSFSYHGLSAEGIDLDLVIERSGSPQITLMDQSDALPEPEGNRVRTRPPDLMSAPWPPFDSTLVVSRSTNLAVPAQ